MMTLGTNMTCIPIIDQRTSVRDFEDTPIEQDVLLRVLEAGRKAPSAKNRQPWRFIVSREQAQRNRIQEAAYGQEHVGRAPVIISACTTNIDYRMPNGQLSYPIDLSFAVSSMMMQAQGEGLGSCVVTTFNEAELKDLLTVPYSMRIVMLLLIGHPRGPLVGASRKPMEQIFSYDHW